MQTTMLCSVGVFSTTTICSPAGRRCRVQRWRRWRLGVVGRERRDRSRPWRRRGRVARPHLGFVSLDDDVDRRRIDIAFGDQDRFQGADPKRDFGQRRALPALAVAVIVVGDAVA